MSDQNCAGADLLLLRDLMDLVATRRAHGLAGGEVLAHEAHASRLIERVAQLLEENAGFTNEVLQNYEQLNLVFDLAHELSRITELAEVQRLLLQRTARVLMARRLYRVTSVGDFTAHDLSKSVPAHAPAAAPLTQEEVMPLVRELRTSQQATIRWLGEKHVLAAPLVRLDKCVDVLFAAREPDAVPFNTLDLSLTESVLTFGGQIITNTELHERVRRTSLEVTRAMVSAIDKKDHYTSDHSQRGGFLTRLTAQEMGVGPEALQYMEWAGLLHDVGKIGIPEAILCKPGKLTAAEFDVIKQHPVMGYEILKPIASFELVLDGVLYHHEHPDGSGYPEGLTREEIPLVARIIHVVDTFDALTSTRPYRQASSIEKAMGILRSELDVRIDRAAAESFFRAFTRYRRENPDDFDVRFADVREFESDP